MKNTIIGDVKQWSKMVIIGKKAVKSKGWSISTNLCHEFFVHCTWKAFIQALCTPGYHACCNININCCLCKSVQQKLFVDNIFSCKKTKQKLKLIMNYFITTSFNRCNKRWKDFEVSFESYSIFYIYHTDFHNLFPWNYKWCPCMLLIPPF